ncbi:MAG: LysR family transcriptional regulator [Lautropia sp.]|nr:LysR family transcriptional regulator [Lautropia sp.]
MVDVMNQELWQLFVDGAELGSLSKVAAAHSTSQPFVSKKINHLENQCGGRLFYRTGRGVVLTELGKLLLPKIRRWLNDTAELRSDIESMVGNPAGYIRLGALPSTILPMVVPLYEQLRERYPFIRLSVLEGQGAQLESWLDEGRIDLALLFRHQGQRQAGDHLLARSSTYVVAERGSPLTRKSTLPFSALDNVPMAAFCRPNSWRTVLDRLAAGQSIRLNIVCEADSLTMQMKIAASGDACILLGESALASAQAHYPVSAARIVQPEIFHHLVLGMSRHGKSGSAGKTLIALIRSIAQQTPVSSTGVPSRQLHAGRVW